ncbi:MAG: hypothetical protein ACREK2_03135 [Gemmatimonadota bacterium]
MSPEARNARGILHFGYIVLPIAAGADKFVNVLTDWDKYVAPWFQDLLPFSTSTFMALVGVVEIAAGLIVAFRPRIGAWIVAGWLAVIILNLLALPEYWDVALRDVGLLLGAVALGRLYGSANQTATA